MPAFSRQEDIKRAIAIKIRRAKTQAKQGHSDMKLKHPDWCRDATKGDYTMLIKKVTEDCQKLQIRNETFEGKLHEKSN